MCVHTHKAGHSECLECCTVYTLWFMLIDTATWIQHYCWAMYIHLVCTGVRTQALYSILQC